MSIQSIENANAAGQEPLPETKGSVMRGVLVGLIPLGLLAGCVALTVALTALARQLASGSGFFVQQEAALVMVIVGLVLAVTVFAVAVWRVMRRVATWQQSGVTQQSKAALWSLGATAVVIVIPLLLAILLPQHPFS